MASEAVAQEQLDVGWTETFFDLVFVVVVAGLNDVGHSGCSVVASLSSRWGLSPSPSRRFGSHGRRKSGEKHRSVC